MRTPIIPWGIPLFDSAGFLPKAWQDYLDFPPSLLSRGFTGKVTLARLTPTGQESTLTFENGVVVGVAGDGSAALADHGALAGLTDDDHPQYLTTGRGDTRYAQLGHTHSGMHDPVTVSSSSSITLSLAGQALSATTIFGSTAGTVCQGNDARLSDARTPTAHAHTIADVTGLQTALDGKQAAGSYAAASHTHIIADVTGLQTALDGKQAAGSYAAASHSHAASDITSGVMATARLGSGTADSTTYLRGDGTWAVPAAGGGDDFLWMAYGV